MDKEKILYQPDGYLKLLDQYDADYPIEDLDEEILLWDDLEDID